MFLLLPALLEREKTGNPVRVGVVGAGYMGRGLVYQMTRYHPGMRVVAIANRSIKRAIHAYSQAGLQNATTTTDSVHLDSLIDGGIPAVTDDFRILCQASKVDVIIEATGVVEHGANVCLAAFEGHKHVVLMNAELDATIGPLLKVYADKAGVIISNADGDQPGVIMNLFRYVQTIGFKPVLAGNMKGFHDTSRTPSTQASFAAQHLQSAHMVTSFADGSKLSMEMAVVANATGFRVGCRGMHGPRCNRVEDSAQLFDPQQMMDGGLVDYILCSQPAGGVFVIAHCDDPIQTPYLRYYKMGDGPFYVFYSPYHLPHVEGSLTAARAVIFHDATIAPQAGPVAEVITVSKTNLRKGTQLDGIGGYFTYGLLENSPIVKEGRLLPLGLAEGCVLKRDVEENTPLTFQDVEVPLNRLIDKLYFEQCELFNNNK